MSEARQSDLLYHGFIKEMIETTDDEEIVNILEEKADDDVECLAVGVFGEKEKVDVLTKKFSLWKPKP